MNLKIRFILINFFNFILIIKEFNKKLKFKYKNF